jgi:hypothetical protein
VGLGEGGRPGVCVPRVRRYLSRLVYVGLGDRETAEIISSGSEFLHRQFNVLTAGFETALARAARTPRCTAPPLRFAQE